VDASSATPREDLAAVERELGAYSPELLEKPRVTVLTKADLLAPELHAGAAAAAGLPDALLISAHSGEGMPALLERLWKLIATERADEPAIHG
jgi:GTP-binding protein